jgi:hypothetical protein
MNLNLRIVNLLNLVVLGNVELMFMIVCLLWLKEMSFSLRRERGSSKRPRKRYIF